MSISVSRHRSPLTWTLFRPWVWNRWLLCLVVALAPITYFLSCAPAYYLLYRSIGNLVGSGSGNHQPGDAVSSARRNQLPAVRCVNAFYAPVKASMTNPAARKIYCWEFQLLIDTFGDPIRLRF